MLSLGPLKLANPEGLWAFLSVLPLILLYLVRPRPKPIKIPSLMFYMKAQGAKKLTSFFRQITKDWLFLLQMLIVILLAFTFVEPLSTYQHDVTASNTVIVLDASASMQAEEGARTRFSISVNKAKNMVGAKNTIILAKDVPYIALQDGTSMEAIKYLDTIEPYGTESQIGEAIILAGETLNEGRVIVLSDFINTGGQDPEIAKNVLESKGLVVDFVNILGDTKKNVGIIDVVVGNEETDIYIKNYDDTAYNVGIETGKTKSSLNIGALSTETYTIQTPPGVTKIHLDHNDDLPADNVAYISSPPSGRAKVLLITNNESVFLKNALTASGEIILEIAKPPVIPKEDYDVYILSEIDMTEILPGTFEDIKQKVEKGASVIVHYQNDTIDYKGLNPVQINEGTVRSVVNVDQLNAFTKNIEFGSATIRNAIIDKDSTKIVSVSEQPAIAFKQKGIGKYMYYGIGEENEFKYSTSYPIFWTELIKYLTAQQDIRNLNYKTGNTLILEDEQTITTPRKKVKKNLLILDDIGIYQLEDRTIAANLNSQLESDINAKKEIGTKSKAYELRPVKETREFDWAIALILAALAFILFELLVIKKRGDV